MLLPASREAQQQADRDDHLVLVGVQPGPQPIQAGTGRLGRECRVQLEVQEAPSGEYAEEHQGQKAVIGNGSRVMASPMSSRSSTTLSPSLAPG